jgi:hypothetical protein
VAVAAAVGRLPATTDATPLTRPSYVLDRGRRLACCPDLTRRTDDHELPMPLYHAITPVLFDGNLENELHAARPVLDRRPGRANFCRRPARDIPAF